MKKVIPLLISLLFGVMSNVQAAYLRNVPVTITQPSGEKINCFASGDEYYNWLHDANNFTIIRDKTTGYYAYAIIADGQLSVSSYIVGSVDPASVGIDPGLKVIPERGTLKSGMIDDISYAPKTGDYNNIVIFIRFADQEEFTEDNTFYEDQFNGQDFSMRGYFSEVSGGQLDVYSSLYPVSTDSSVVSYQDAQVRDYYVPYDSVTNLIGYVDDAERTEREHTLLENAINSVKDELESSGTNFDSDDDGYVDNICFIVQGTTEGWSELLWPHKWALYSYNVTISGNRVWEYNFQLSEVTDVSVLCHEMFHTLGAPDLYHYSDESNDLYPVAGWDLMAWDYAQHMLTWMKFQYGNWFNEIPEITQSGTYKLPAVGNSSFACYKIPVPESTDEFFMVEYRKKIGYDTKLPASYDEGLLVYRVNTAVTSGNRNGPPDELYVLRPGVTENAPNGSWANATFSADEGRMLINENSDPLALLADGTQTSLSIYDVGFIGDSIEFKVGSPESIHTLTGSDVSIDSAGVITACSYDFSTTDIIIPDTLCDQLVTGIGAGIFSSQGITSVELPSTLISIGNMAFQNNSLTNIDLSVCPGLSYIYDNAFESNNLDTLFIPASVLQIGSETFVSNNLSEVLFQTESNIEEIGNSAFSANPDLLEISFPTHMSEDFSHYEDDSSNSYSPGDSFTDFVSNYVTIFNQDTLLSLEARVNIVDAACNGGQGSIEINISGGLGGTYGLGGQLEEALTDSNSYVVMIYDVQAQNFVEEEVLHDASDSTNFLLNAGEYQVTVEDNAGNDTQITVVVSEPEALLLDVSIRGIATLPGDSLEIIDVAAFGGIAPYRYEVYRDVNLMYPSTDVDSFVVPTGAEYEVIVQDANGCLASTVIYIETIDLCPQHFHPVWEGSNPNDPMNVFVVDAKIDGVDLEPGDQIGIFDDTICVGYGKVEQTIEGENILSIVVGADDGTGTGYTPGNEISCRIWRCNDQREYLSVDKQCYTNESVPITCSSFQVGASSYVALSVTSTINFAADFYPGWNIFSSPVNPDSTDLEFVFSNLINTSILLKIQDETGASLEDHGTFGGWINNIGKLHPAEGYKVKVTEYDSLYITGQLVNYPYGIILNSGWNIIGFPSMQVVDGMEVVQQLLDKGTLIKVQDQQGNSIEDLGMFGGWQNFIGSFWAGRGFKVKVSAPDTLWIYENYAKSSTIKMESVATTHFKPVFTGNGVDHMNFNFVNLSAGMINPGDELAIFDGDNCVGAVTLLPKHFEKNLVSIPASAADGSWMVGFTEGNNYSFRLWQAEQYREVSIHPDLIKGEPSFTKNESAILSMELLAMDVNELTEITAVRCYPNPFDEEITVNVQLAADAKVEMQVMNQTGQVVNRLVERQVFPHGSHNLIWGGKNDGGQSVSSGIYYLRITIGDRMYNKKIVYNR
ncbi:M6 family metalloprotease domain-containing protein [Draconibacterium sp. IB214405]|uniref:M6 family metalloprotease domain-containing protein n=1 Tax=Draconibacterium sp. IB214405 TaxID=3097352 RepID=UPI002A0D51B2|nr:M6 family metalloprotease domain-containing protein [Draconibacterium sp. IB214405]MDX8339276.1 M6 family metalloprotease domain-containing protein [Draconibacterium sp. IB214405]